MRILLCVVSLFVMFSCSQNAERERRVALLAPDGTIEPVATKIATADKPVPERKLIRNGSIFFQVESVTTTRSKIYELTNAAGGYVSSETQDAEEGRPNYRQVIRVPGTKVDEFVSKVESLAKAIDSRKISVQDVTAEYVDIESRLSAKQKLEARYLEIVKQATTIEDILKVEDQLGTVRSEIESMQGQLKLFSSQVAYGTLELTYYEPYTIATPGVGSKFASSFVGGWDALVALLIGLTATWPFLIIIGASAWLYWHRINRQTKEISPQ